jgi:sec-independent protein translocase protein TatA
MANLLVPEQMILLMASLGAPELLIILVIVIVIFGAGKLPEIGGALGKGIREFRTATKELQGAQDDVQEVADEVEAIQE